MKRPKPFTDKRSQPIPRRLMRSGVRNGSGCTVRKKHLSGRIGAVVLVVLYTIAILADILSPYTISWTDKTKSFEPPSDLHFIYEDDSGRISLRPFCYEMSIADVVFKRYSVVPEHTIRAISIERFAGFDETRIVATDESAYGRKRKIIEGLEKRYGFGEDSATASLFSSEIDSLESSRKKDIVKKLAIDTDRRESRESSYDILLVKGNKNFLGFFYEGAPYYLFGVIPCSLHFFGSRTGGYYAFGADQLGRDICSRVIHGSRISLSIGIIGILLSFSIALLAGGIAGYFGGIADLAIMRICDAVLSFPALLLLIALRAAFPVDLGSVRVYLLIVVVMSLFDWAYIARIIRGMVLSLKNEEYVLAARATGVTDLTIIVEHLFRNSKSFVIAKAAVSIPGYIIGESALSFLGLGIAEPDSSWGLMLSVGSSIRTIGDFPWLLVPGFFVFAAITAWNLLGDWLQDATDPRYPDRMSGDDRPVARTRN